MHFPESQPVFFKFNEFLNDKCNIVLKILESVGRQVLIELSHKHCAGHLPGLIRFPRKTVPSIWVRRTSLVVQ